MKIKEEVVLVPTPTVPMRTVVYRPQEEGEYPAILLYSEIFQLTGPILRSAQMMAGQGFVVACPEGYVVLVEMVVGGGEWRCGPGTELLLFPVVVVVVDPTGYWRAMA